MMNPFGFAEGQSGLRTRNETKSVDHLRGEFGAVERKSPSASASGWKRKQTGGAG